MLSAATSGGLDWDSARHIANRVGFGATSGQIREIQAQGLRAYLEAQLAADPSDPALPAWAPSLPTLSLTALELHALYPKPSQDQKAEKRRRKDSGEMAPMEEKKPKAGKKGPIEEFQRAKLLRAVGSPYPLLEVMEDFWFNHFNVDARKGPSRWMTGPYLRDVIRPRALGTFPQLLEAVAESPAMLFYLDNWKSSYNRRPESGVRSPVSSKSRPRGGETSDTRQKTPDKKSRRGLNENYGRELLELHTLGVDGGYSQEDVVGAARTFTGWTLQKPNQGEGAFVFRKAWHDPGPKQVLDWKSQGGGEAEARSLLRYLALHPTTARRICRKLAQRFVEDDPSSALVDRLTTAYEKTGGDIRKVLRALFLSPEFMDPGVRQAKVRSPFEWLAASLRVLGASLGPYAQPENILVQMGQPTFHCEPPTGYPETGKAWAHPGALLARWNAGLALASGQFKGAILPGEWNQQSLIELFNSALGKALSPSTRETILAEPSSAAKVALVLGSPEFQRR